MEIGFYQLWLMSVIIYLASQCLIRLFSIFQLAINFCKVSFLEAVNLYTVILLEFHSLSHDFKLKETENIV